MDLRFYNPAATKTPRAAELCGAEAIDMMIDASVSAVLLPDNVLQELRKMGINPDALNEWQKMDVIMAARDDGIVFEDAEGDNLQDMLTLTWEERQKREEKKSWRDKVKREESGNFILAT